jgi:hypothetical protein
VHAEENVDAEKAQFFRPFFVSAAIATKRSFPAVNAAMARAASSPPWKGIADNLNQD